MYYALCCLSSDDEMISKHWENALNNLTKAVEDYIREGRKKDEILEKLEFTQHKKQSLQSKIFWATKSSKQKPPNHETKLRQEICDELDKICTTKEDPEIQIIFQELSSRLKSIANHNSRQSPSPTIQPNSADESESPAARGPVMQK